LLDGKAGEVSMLDDIITGISPTINTLDYWVWLPDVARGFSIKSCHLWLTKEGVSTF